VGVTVLFWIFQTLFSPIYRNVSFTFKEPNFRNDLRSKKWLGYIIFKPNMPAWVNFGGPWNGKGLYILWPFEICYGQLVYFMAIG
jgi:hypothetical protein